MNRAGRCSYMVSQCALWPSFYRSEGGDRMTDYEMIMVNLTILSVVVGLLIALINNVHKH